MVAALLLHSPAHQFHKDTRGHSEHIWIIAPALPLLTASGATEAARREATVVGFVTHLEPLTA